MKPFFIAEAGINHNGSVDMAIELINLAKSANCDLIKFQKRDLEASIPMHMRSRMLYGTPWGDVTYYEYKQKIEFGKEEYDEIARVASAKGLLWTASVWDITSARFIQSYGVRYHKIPSVKIRDLELLREVSSYGKHTFISTGAATLDDIRRAVHIFRKAECSFTLLHCVAVYPMPNHYANLAYMKKLRHLFDCTVGWSGHEVGTQVSIAAAAIGADVIERHITLNRSLWGSDQAASLGPNHLRFCVRDCRIARQAIGKQEKVIYQEERLKMLEMEV